MLLVRLEFSKDLLIGKKKLLLELPIYQDNKIVVMQRRNSIKIFIKLNLNISKNTKEKFNKKLK